MTELRAIGFDRELSDVAWNRGRWHVDPVSDQRRLFFVFVRFGLLSGGELRRCPQTRSRDNRRRREFRRERIRFADEKRRRAEKKCGRGRCIDRERDAHPAGFCVARGNWKSDALRLRLPVERGRTSPREQWPCWFA